MTRPLRTVALALVVLVASGGALAQPAQAPFSVPAPQTMPDGPLGDAVKQGLSIMNATKAALPANVGSVLNCSSCHLNAGTVPHASPFVGLWGVYPAYETRSASVETLADRINDCFERSMNGKALDVDSAPMRAMLAYVAWLSTGVPTGTSVAGRGFRAVASPPSPPDAGRGATLFEQKCAACHGRDGGGLRAADGSWTFPPVWGPASFNAGAGMTRVEIAAAFIQAKMPLGRGGTLAVQDAWDIAALVAGAPRPAFVPARARAK